MNLIKRIFCMVLCIAIVISMTPAMEQNQSNAAGYDPNGKYVKVDNTTMTIDQLYDWLDDHGDEGQHKIRMLDNWLIDETLEFPQGCNIELYMDGHVIRRYSGSSIWSDDDSVIFFGENGSAKSFLTIYGGTTEVVNKFNGYLQNENRETTVREAKGGLITGGLGDNDGGAIYMNGDNLNLTLDGVTLAGNSADSDGGAIWIDDENCRVSLKDSTIQYNWAEGDGGGIFINDNGSKVIMDNSKIRNNYAGDNGGGIYTDTYYAENLVIKGKNGSTVDYNSCNDENGGGIFLGNDCINVAGLEITGNEATNGQGGGIFTSEETITIGNCKINNNTSKKEGGGIYIANDNTIINGCEITGNKASLGGGVFVEPDIDEGFVLSGRTVIKSNPGSKYHNNLYMSDSDPEDSTIETSGLIRGSNVHIGYDPEEIEDIDKLKVSPDQNAYDSQFLKSDNTKRYFKWDEKDRNLYLVKGTKPATAEAEKVTAGAATKTGEEYEGYDLMHGYLTHADSAGGDDNDVEFYYTDGFFDESNNPSVYNEHLATASLNFVSTSAASAVGGTSDYKTKHANVRQFLSDIGCDDQNIYVNDAYTKKPTSSSIGVAIGSKPLIKKDEDTGRILVPVTIRSAGYEQEWASNAVLGADGEASGFSSAADMADEEVYNYIVSHDLTDAAKEGKLVFWITGFSRGGATANLLSRRLVEKYAGSSDGLTFKNNTVYAYTFATPIGGFAATEIQGIDYSCIHNCINYADLVPLVAPSKMGFKRYGVDHYIPGTEAGTATNYKDNENNNCLADNQPLKSDSKEYTDLKSSMKKQLSFVDSAKMFDDYFGAAYFCVGGGGTYFGMDVAGKAAGNVESWEREFINKLVEKSVHSRTNYATTKLNILQKDYETMENAISGLLQLYFGMDSDTKQEFVENVSTISSYITPIDGIDLWKNLLGEWGELSDDSKNAWIEKIWNWIDETGALESLSDSEYTTLHKSFPVILDLAMSFTDWDYNDDDNERLGIEEGLVYTGTLVYNLNRILSNHYFETYLAWTRSCDSFYDNASHEYDVVLPDSINAPSALVAKNTSKDENIRFLSDTTNKLAGDKKLILDVEDSKGEAIYYTIENLTDETKSEEMLYTGPIELPYAEGSYTLYRIEAKAFQYGQYSDTVSYTIKVTDPRHKVTVKYGDLVKSRMYYAKASATVTGTAPEGMVFNSWKVSIENIDNSENIILNDNGELAKKVLGSDYEKLLKKSTVTFTLPEFKEEAYSDYELIFEAQYAEKISTFEIDGTVPVSGTSLPSEFTLKSDTKEWKTVEPQWSYEYKGKEIVAAGKAYNDAVYTAVLKMDQDDEKGIAFADGIKPSDITFAENLCGVTVSDVSKDATSGSLSVTLKFEPTASEGGDNRPEAMKQLTIQAYDANKGEYMTDMKLTYYVVEGKPVTVSAPSSEDEIFIKWNEDSDFNVGGITTPTINFTPSEDKSSYTITAIYYPVVKSISAKLSGEPKAGDNMPVVDEFNVTVKNTYGIDPSDLKISWTPDVTDNKAEYSTSYTANISLDPRDEDGKIHIISINDSPVDTYINGKFLFGTSVDSTVNGETAGLDKETGLLSYTFDETEVYKQTITSLSKITERIDGLPSNCHSIYSVSKYLPKSLKGYLVNDGGYIDLQIEWEKLDVVLVNDKEPHYGYDPVEYIAKGKAIIPKGYRASDDLSLELTVNVGVSGAPLVKTPVASVESGVYHDNFSVILETDKDAEIYYTLDGSEPHTRSLSAKGAIEIKRGENPNEPIILKAVAYNQNYRPSTIATYIYTFDNSVYIPNGRNSVYDRESHIGVRAGDFYTLSVDKNSKATIDEDGNVIATEPGKYDVTAKVNRGYQWITGTDDMGSPLTSLKEQTITFEISRPVDYDGSVKMLKTVLAKDAALIAAIESRLLKKDEIGAKAELEELQAELEDIKSSNTGLLKAEPEQAEILDALLLRITTAIAKADSLEKIRKQYTPSSKQIRALSRGKGSITVKWYKANVSTQKKFTGYQMRYSLKKDFSSGVKYKKVKKSSKSVNIKNLKRNKKYYVQLRKYMTYDGKTYYSSWSKTKSKTTK